MTQQFLLWIFYPKKRKTLIRNDIFSPMFIVTLFTIHDICVCVCVCVCVCLNLCLEIVIFKKK